MKRPRSLGIAVFFILFACKKKPEPVVQVAPTETGTIAVASASASAPASAAETIASASASSVRTIGPIGLGIGASSGYAPEEGMFGRTHVAKVRLGTVTVSGKIAPEVVRRIARAKINSFRACYEAGLQRNPKLMGSVATKYTIGVDGAVTSAKDDGSDLPDAAVVQCVVRIFRTLAHPQPEDGTATVVFPLTFSPPE